MIILFDLLLSSAALLLIVPVGVLFIEVLFAVTERKTLSSETGERRRLAIIIPAHNESSIIADALRSIVPQLRELDRILVVADNCVDDTATIAHREGAEVVVRTDSIHRGKGYALDAGVRHLEHDPPDTVIVIDADCQVTQGAIDRLARVCARIGRPTQALYLMYSPDGAAITTRIGELAWTVKNRVRPSGLRRLGLPCQLMGTGMAFPWMLINTAVLSTGHIVEDLKLGIELARAGAPPLFCPDALVTSFFPVSKQGIGTQRTRWEHGYLSVMLREAPQLLLRAIVTLDADLMAVALDLSVPPLALLMLQLMIVWMGAATLYFFTATAFPLIIASAALAILVLSIFLSWARYGRHIVSLRYLAYALWYSLCKIPLYAKFLARRQLDWVRSKRDGDGPR